jgi:hypothetical protein
MQRLSVWLRWIAAGFFTLIIIPLLVEFLKHLAENTGLYDRELSPNLGDGKGQAAAA